MSSCLLDKWPIWPLTFYEPLLEQTYQYQCPTLDSFGQRKKHTYGDKTWKKIYYKKQTKSKTLFLQTSNMIYDWKQQLKTICIEIWGEFWGLSVNKNSKGLSCFLFRGRGGLTCQENLVQNQNSPIQNGPAIPPDLKTKIPAELDRNSTFINSIVYQFPAEN